MAIFHLIDYLIPVGTLLDEIHPIIAYWNSKNTRIGQEKGFIMAIFPLIVCMKPAGTLSDKMPYLGVYLSLKQPELGHKWAT